MSVCYAPLQIVATEASVRRMGRTGVAVRKGPSFDAEITLDNRGNEVTVPLGRHIAQQSVREHEITARAIKQLRLIFLGAAQWRPERGAVPSPAAPGGPSGRP